MTTGNVRDENLREYLESFLDTLQSTANQYLKPEFHKRLLHLSYLPARIMGYVSTQFGTAIEYIPSDSTSIEIVLGSQRAEDLLFGAPKKIRNIGPAFSLGGSMCSMTNLSIEGAFRLGNNTELLEHHRAMVRIVKEQRMSLNSMGGEYQPMAVST